MNSLWLTEKKPFCFEMKISKFNLQYTVVDCTIWGEDVPPTLNFYNSEFLAFNILSSEFTFEKNRGYNSLRIASRAEKNLLFFLI